jgi:hypothetical protein
VTCWLGVVSRDHVQRGKMLGIAQIGHGTNAGLSRMRTGDGLVYYSPRVAVDSTRPLRAFTAIGRIADDEVWQAEEGDSTPWRRRVEYDSGAAEVPLVQLQSDLELTQGPHWGYRLRRGLVELSGHDFKRIALAMGSRCAPDAGA